jgi:hypothetical protein
MLTLVVNTKAKASLVIAVYNSAEAGAGGRFRIHFTNLAVIPAPSLRIGTLLDKVFGVKVVQANLPIYPSSCAERKSGAAHLFPTVVGDGSKRRHTNRGDAELFMDPLF